MSHDRSIPSLRHWATLEDDGQYVGEVEADIRPDEDLDNSEHKAAFCGHEDAHELEQDCELRGQDCWRVADLVDVKQLEWPLAPPFIIPDRLFASNGSSPSIPSTEVSC